LPNPLTVRPRARREPGALWAGGVRVPRRLPGPARIGYTGRMTTQILHPPTTTLPAPTPGWQPLPFPDVPDDPTPAWWLAVLERALISRAMDDLEVTKEYKPNPDRPQEGKL
jgi:hypothetical protein